MNKSTAIFVMLFLFSTGVSLGMGISIYKNINESQEELLVSKKDSVQDSVIKEVQKDQDEKYKVQEVVAKDEEKISPYAKITIEKYYKQCGHSTVEIYDVPKEMANLTKEELQNRYKNWEIKKFTEKDIQIYREIDANCSSHYVLKEKDGYLAVYKAISKNMDELSSITDIEYASLKDEDKIALDAGIKIYGTDELSTIIEDFSS